MKRWASAALAALFAMPAWAGEFSVGMWAGASYGDGGKTTHCGIHSTFKSGDGVMFLAPRGGGLSMMLTNERWRIPADSRYPVQYRAGELPGHEGEARAVPPNAVIIAVADPDRLQADLARSDALMIVGGATTLAYRAKDAAKAIEAVRACMSRALAEEKEQAVTNPFAPRATAETPRPAKAAPASAEERADLEDMERRAMRMVEDLADLPGFEKVRRKKPTEPYLGIRYHGAWASKGAVGMVRFVPSRGLETMEGVQSDWIRETARNCLGEIAVETIPAHASDLPIRRARMHCREEAGEIVSHYLVVGKPDEFLEILVIGTADPGQAAEWGETIAGLFTEEP